MDRITIKRQGQTYKIMSKRTNISSTMESTMMSPLDFWKKELEYEEKPSLFQKHNKFLKAMLVDERVRMARGKARVTTKLHLYQIEAVLKVVEHYSHFKEKNEFWDDDDENLIKPCLIVAPAGSGKSGIVCLLPYALASKKVLVLTPSKIISQQIAAEFGYPDIKITSPFFQKCGMFFELRDLKNVLEPVLLANNSNDMELIGRYNLVIVNAQKFGGKSGSSLSSVKTIEDRQKVREQLQDFDTIIIDEAHHYPAKTWENIVNVFQGKRVVFLTATPFRGSLGNETSMKLLNSMEMVYEISSSELEGKTIRKTEFIERIAASKNLLDPEFLSQVKHDIYEILDKHLAQETRAEDSFSKEQKHQPQAMILVRTKIEAKEVAAQLGDEATFVVSEKSSKQNTEDFSEGRKRIAVVCGMLKEGYDNSNVTLAVILRNCQSRVLFEQFVGRCMRMRRTLTGKQVDKTTGIVLSYQHFKQRKMWEKRLEMASHSPVEDDDEL